MSTRGAAGIAAIGYDANRGWLGRRRPRRADARTLVLLDALEDALFAGLAADALLIATARVIAREFGCLCIIERIAGGQTRVVGLAHPDPAIAERLRVVHEPHTAVSSERATRIARRAAPLVVHRLRAGEQKRWGLADVARWTGQSATSFMAAPLIARGETLGVLWAVRTRRGRRMPESGIVSFVRGATVVSRALAAASASAGVARDDGAAGAQTVKEQRAEENWERRSEW